MERSREIVAFDEQANTVRNVNTHLRVQQAVRRNRLQANYIGHGGIHLWADELVFTATDVRNLEPRARWPLVLTMNCLNGYFHFPYFDSLAEALIKERDKGAIAAFSPSGLSVHSAAHHYHEAFLDELLNGGHPRLGDALLAAQKAYSEGGALPELLDIYHLLSDPALTLR